VNDDTSNQSRPLELSEARDREVERLRLSSLRGMRRLPLRSREREDSERELEAESESDALESDAEEADSDSELDDSESDERLDLRAFFFGWLSEPVVFCFSLSFSLASRIKFAVPLFFLNSSGTSTEGFPSALSFASTRGFWSIPVREGRETYGRSDLHS